MANFETVPVVFRAAPGEKQALMTLAQQEHHVNLSEAIRMALRSVLAERGLWPPPAAPADPQPEIKATHNV